MTVVEFASWPIAENVKEPSKSSLKIVRETDGCTDLFLGKPEEESKMVQLVVVWESLEHHQMLIKAPNYPEVISGIKSTLPAGTGLEALSMYHVDFAPNARTPGEDDPTAALTAKVTEQVVMTLKEGKTKDDLATILDTIRDLAVQDSKQIQGISTPIVWGQAVEDPKVFILLIGWDSSDLHREVVAHDKFRSVLGNLVATVDLKMWHIPFNKHD